MGIDIASVVKALEELAGPAAAASAIAREAVLAEAKRGAAYGQSIAPVNKTGVPHTTKGGYRDEPGDYKKSISGEAIFVHGAWRGRVISRDWKAHWIEYGTKHMPAMHIMLRTRRYLQGTGS
ncbi:hypothetical protein [Nocardia pseudovaccinii]|uniref:hypothetical protein n=1 Tax=Nocardia pseudovaccinii TaxID=189540 RepID=UPI0007A434D7|nr:hypothetical protein [Nocardia pseudovaccinii]